MTIDSKSVNVTYFHRPNDRFVVDDDIHSEQNTTDGKWYIFIKDKQIITMIFDTRQKCDDYIKAHMLPIKQAFFKDNKVG